MKKRHCDILIKLNIENLRCMLIFSSLIALLLIRSAFGAADTLSLTLEDALNLAFRQSPSMISTRADSVISESRWRVVRGNRLPQLRYSQDVPSWTESIDQRFFYDSETEEQVLKSLPSGDLRWTEEVSLDQELPWGATMSFSSQLNKREWYWTYSEEKESFSEYSWQNRALITQPILAGNPAKRNYEIGRINHSIGMIDYEISRREVVFGVTRKFYDLVSAQGALEIADQDLESGRSSEALALRKLNAGLIPEVELLQIQVDVARREGSYKQSRNAYINARDQFKLDLGIPLDQPISLNFSLGIDSMIASDSLTAGALPDDRMELNRQKMLLDQLSLNTKNSIWGERVSASIQAYLEVDSRQDSFQDLNEPGDRNAGVSIRIDIPLFGFGTTSGKIQELKTAQKKAEAKLRSNKAKLEADYNATLRSVQLALDQIAISVSALKLSEKSLSITEERFENGIIDSRELLDSQIGLSRSRRDLLNAKISYSLALAGLHRIAPPPEWLK